jgi:hypothetical protein
LLAIDKADFDHLMKFDPVLARADEEAIILFAGATRCYSCSHPARALCWVMTALNRGRRRERRSCHRER